MKGFHYRFGGGLQAALAACLLLLLPAAVPGWQSPAATTVTPPSQLSPPKGRGDGGGEAPAGAEIRVGVWEDKAVGSPWRAASLGAGGTVLACGERSEGSPAALASSAAQAGPVGRGWSGSRNPPARLLCSGFRAWQAPVPGR